MRALRHFVCLVCLFFVGCREAPLYQQEAFVFGTRVEVLVAGVPHNEASAAVHAVLQEFDRLHRTYHPTEASELSAFNAAIAAGQTVSVSPELMGFIEEARRFSIVSGGRFDPGIGSLVKLWGFQSEGKTIEPPAAALILAWQKAPTGIVDLELIAGRVRAKNPRVALDFGGYLKGLALDNAVALFRAKGIHNALINIGGNIMALGTKNGAPWRVGILHPRKASPLASLVLHDGEAIGTSGDYQRYFEFHGRRYCHILDPKTGEPPVHTQALTLLIPAGHRAGTLSDMGSKPLFLAGNTWPILAKTLGLQYILRVDHAGEIEVSEALYQRLVFSSPLTEVVRRISFEK